MSFETLEEFRLTCVHRILECLQKTKVKHGQYKTSYNMKRHGNMYVHRTDDRITSQVSKSHIHRCHNLATHWTHSQMPQPCYPLDTFTDATTLLPTGHIHRCHNLAIHWTHSQMPQPCYPLDTFTDATTLLPTGHIHRSHNLATHWTLPPLNYN